MDDGLWGTQKTLVDTVHICLNPCCCGWWSLSPPESFIIMAFPWSVLILVVVDDGLWVRWIVTQRGGQSSVLILVVVDDGLWVRNPFTQGLQFADVLILVVVDDGLWAYWREVYKEFTESLNPCCCGWWSLRRNPFTQGLQFAGLNPCCCGWWSLRTKSAMWWPLDYYVPKNEENVVFWWEKCTSLAPDFSKKLLSMQSYQ